MKLEVQQKLAKKSKNVFLRLLEKIRSRTLSSNQKEKKILLVAKIDFLIDTLLSNKLDILYMEHLKMPLTQEEKIYFTQQVDRIQNSIDILLWMRENVLQNSGFWKKFFIKK